MTYLREAGVVPWGWIEDDTRTLHEWECAPSVAQFLLDAVDYARIDPWLEGVRPVILTESRATGGVLARGIAAEYLCPVAATNGQAGGFLVTKVAPLLKEEETRVLYVGDFDLSGSQIEENTRSVLERHAGRVFDQDTWERVAITEVQAKDLRARGIQPIEKNDRRYKGGFRHGAYEAEALGQETVEHLLRDRLDQLLPEPLITLQHRQEHERAALEELLQRHV